MRLQYPLLLLVLAASACSGNPPTLPVARPGDLVSTRAELEQRLADYEASLASSEYSAEEQRRVSAEAETIRQRLEYGDFRVGDRILLSVQGEETLPDTAIVEPGQVIDLPLFGEIPVAGVLRSEIADHLSGEFSRFLREPVVRASGLVRVAVLGSVGNPGFFTMPAETMLADAIMAAGGPTGNANVDQVRIRRGPEEIMGGDQTRLALQQGLTLDQLNLQGGDQVTVPQRRGFLGILGIMSTVVGSLGFILWRVL